MSFLAEDVELVRRAKAGDLEAFERLASRHERQVYSLAFRILRNAHDAEDVTQQAFLSVVEHLSEFREESSFATWLLRITTYAALKVLRKRRGLPTVSLEESTEGTDTHVPHPEYIASWRDSPENLVHLAEVRRLVEESLDALPEKYRLVFVLRDIENRSVRETAELLGITEVNVKVRLLRSRLQLREMLTRALGDPLRKATREHGALPSPAT